MVLQGLIRKERKTMTKEQWTELMNDTKLPWPTIIDDTLKQIFIKETAEELFDRVLEAAWDRHLSLGHFKGEDFSIAQAASEVIDEAGTDNYIVLAEKKDGKGMETAMKGKPVNLKALFAGGITNFIESLAKETGEDPEDCFLDFASTLFTGCMIVLGKHKGEDKDD
jgi:hypothetical protein